MTINNCNFGIVETDCLDVGAIVALAERELVAVRIPRWCPEEVCSHFLKRIDGIVGVGYDDEPTFHKIIGGAVYGGALSEYLRLASHWTSEQRSAFSPHISPIDRLRLEFEERWPHGCALQRFIRRPSFAGLIRAFEDGGEARPHQDVTPWDIPDVPEAHEFTTQLSAVCYLGCAQTGGNLELWNFGFNSKTEYKQCKVVGDYSIDRKYIGEPSVSLTPKAGELIIFNARNLHAVSRVILGKRSTQSTFIAYRGRNRHLSAFS